METKVIKFDGTDEDFAKQKEAAKLLDSGSLVAFPTETVYGIASRVQAHSLARLTDIKGRDPKKPYTLHIGRKWEVSRYVPKLAYRTRKLIDKAWPGPLTIVFELDAEDIEAQKEALKPEVFEGLYRDNCIGVRCPDNPIASALLRKSTYAVVAPSANAAGGPPAVDAEQVMAEFSGKIDMVLDGGPCKYGRSSTVVKIGKETFEVLRPGVYTEAELQAASQINFLVVCTGNTCRSPMAEGIFRKYLAEKLHCEVDRLGEMGYKVSSVGMLNLAGRPATDEAVTACAAMGVDITAHRSQALTRRLIDESDRIFAMERMHQASVVAYNPDAANKCVLLAGDDEIGDPVGQPQAVYNKCADLIEKAVKKSIGEFLI